MKIRTLIIDDEPIGREIIETYVQKIEFLELVASCEDAFEAFDYLEKEKIDLILSDIQMPRVNGMELLNSLISPPLIIFITAHDSFAMEGYDMGVVDYLLKPVAFERFLKAINKVKKLLLADKTKQKTEPEFVPEYIFLKVENKLCKIIFSEILYIESVKDYQKIHLTSDKYLLVYSTLKSMEERLPCPPFFRIHYSYMVNTRQIKYIQGNTVELISNKMLPVSLSKKDDLLKELKIE